MPSFQKGSRRVCPHFALLDVETALAVFSHYHNEICNNFYQKRCKITNKQC